MVYYRKYRPQKISELDLLSVRARLTSILSANDMPHAFLFTGPKGLGKTSSARILAKAINCQSKTDIEPCNECDICLSITAGSHIDVIEIDGASNRGVDEIRDLRSKVKFAPSELKMKVYIIDEVHMLTTEAFNALLKTLEEPPQHVVFILATTEAHKIPQTILSRAFSIKFQKPTHEEIHGSLMRIFNGEKLSVDDEVIIKIAKLSDGSFRDAAKILEELSLQSAGAKITNDIFDTVYQSGSVDQHVESLLQQMYKKNVEDSLTIINQIAESGVDFKLVIEEMVARIRAEVLKGKNNELSITDAKELLVLLNEAYGTVKFSVVPQLPLELAVIEWGGEHGDVRVKMKDESSKDQRPTSSNKIQKTELTGPSKTDGELLKSLIDSVHKESRQVAAFLRSCKEATVVGSTLSLTTPYSLHAEKLSKKEFSDLILKNAQSLNNKITAVQIGTA